MYINHPAVVGFRRRFAPQIRFLQQRLTPEGYLGVHLTVGALVIVLATWCFGAIVEDLLTHDPLVIFDQQVARWFHNHATPAVTQAANIVTFFGSPLFLTGASVLYGATLLVQGLRYRLLSLALTMAGGSLLNIVLKGLFHRPRPWSDLKALSLLWSSYSFPSGHVMGSTLFYLFVAFLIAAAAKSWHWRVSAILTAFMLVLLIALSRIYLGMHYLSDVLGAAAAGLAWLAVCVTAVDTLRRYREQRQSS